MASPLQLLAIRDESPRRLMDCGSEPPAPPHCGTCDFACPRQDDVDLGYAGIKLMIASLEARDPSLLSTSDAGDAV
jgi:hypothetical protein